MSRAPSAGWSARKTRPGLHVHHDEQCATGRRHAGRGRSRGGVPEGACLCAASAGRARPTGYTGQGMAPIVHHPDVQRNLLTMQALTRIARAISYTCAHAIDMARVEPEDSGSLARPRQPADAGRQGILHRCRRRCRLASACRCMAAWVSSRRPAPPQLLRDARIAPIYEGTNGIQAIDLVTRKLPLGGGEHVHGYIDELRQIVDRRRGLQSRRFRPTRRTARPRRWTIFREATQFLQQALAEGPMDEALAGATPYLRLFALAAGGAYLAKRRACRRGRGARRALPLLCRKSDRRVRSPEGPRHRRRGQPGCGRRRPAQGLILPERSPI